MSLFESVISGLKGSVGQNLDNNPDDFQKTERELKRQGYFNDAYSEGFITRALDEGLRAFQRDKNLKTDGIIHPGGETEQTLFGRVEKRPSTYDDGRIVFTTVPRLKPISSRYEDTPSIMSDLPKQEPPSHMKSLIKIILHKKRAHQFLIINLRPSPQLNKAIKFLILLVNWKAVITIMLFLVVMKNL